LLANRFDELVRAVRLQRTGRIVEKDAGRTEVRSGVWVPSGTKGSGSVIGSGRVKYR